MKHPTPRQIIKARHESLLSQREAAELIGLGSANRWSEYELGKATIDAARWELFLIKTGQHPHFGPVERKEIA